MKLSVLGGGNGAFAMAGHMALQGMDVTLFELPEFEQNIKGIASRGGVQVKSDESTGLPSGFGKLSKITSRVEEAFKDADLLSVVVPSVAHEAFAKTCGPHLRDGQIVLIHPGNPGGVLVFAKIWKSMKVKSDVLLAEAPTLVYACRKTDEFTVWIRGFKKQLNIAAFPAKRTQKVLQAFKKMYPEFGAEKNVFATGMSNPNTVQHVPPTLLNAGWVESTKGDFLLYRQGVTPATARVIDAIDKERMAIGKGMGIPLTPMKDLLIQWYGHQGAKGETMLEILNSNPAYQQSKAPKDLEARYVTEDVPYGLVPMAAFGKLAKVSTPTTDLMIDLACLLTGIDFRRQGRTLGTMDLAGKTPSQIRRLLETGRV